MILSKMPCLKVFWRSFFSWVLRNRSLSFYLVFLYVITFAIFLPTLCSDWAYSKYYSPLWSQSQMRKRAFDLNDRRLIAAEQFLSLLTPNTTYMSFKSVLQQPDLTLAVGVVTVRRQHNTHRLNYLTQVISQLIQLFDMDTTFDSKALFMCDTFPGPGKHDEALRLKRFVPLFRKFPNENASHVIMDWFEKEKQDYVYCMQQALKYKPKYIMIVEDDAFPRSEIFKVLHYIMTNRLERKHNHGYQEDWAYLKLYYPERWQGYSNEVHTILELIGLGSLGGIAFVVILNFITRKRFRMITQYIFFVLGALYFILVAVSVGRQYMVEWHRLSKHFYRLLPAPDCCSPANVYAQHMAVQLTHFLSSVTCSSHFPMDAALDQFATKHSYQRYVVEPNLIKHIGMVSSIKSEARRLEEFIF